VDIGSFSAALARISPKLKTPIQLTGFIVAGILFFLASVSKPPNLLVQISAGLIAVSILLFGVTLNQVEAIPNQRRAKFIISLYALFGGFAVLLFIISVFFLLMSGDVDRRVRAGELGGIMRSLQSADQAKLTRLVSEQTTIQEQLQKAQLDNPGLSAALGEDLAAVKSEIEALRARLQNEELVLGELGKPSSLTVEVFEAAHKLVGSVLVTSGYAAEAENYKDALKKKLQGAERITMRDSIHLAWLRRITGEVKADEAVKEAEAVWRRYPDSVDALEYVASCHGDVGDFANSQKYYGMLVAALEQARPVDAMRLAYGLKDLATMTRLALGGTNGESIIQRAEAVYLNSNRRDEVIYANIENDFGGFYLAREDLEGAKMKFARALEYFRKPNASTYGYAFVLVNLANVYTRQGNPRAALEFLDIASRVQETTTGLSTVTYAMTLQHQGEALQALQRYPEARMAFERERELLQIRGIRPDLLGYVRQAIEALENK
jgi:tetratricopeptide (TPR) repeat protein